jgi:hypothetical protein
VSDESQNANALADLLLHGSGWAVALLTGAWGLILRILIGRHLKWLDQQHLTNIDIDRRLSNIEGQLAERSRWDGQERRSRPR